VSAGVARRGTGAWERSAGAGAFATMTGRTPFASTSREMA